MCWKFKEMDSFSICHGISMMENHLKIIHIDSISIAKKIGKIAWNSVDM